MHARSLRLTVTNFPYVCIIHFGEPKERTSAGVATPWAWPHVVSSQNIPKPRSKTLLSHLNSYTTIPRGPADRSRKPTYYHPPTIHIYGCRSVSKIEMCSLFNRNAFPQCLGCRCGSPAVGLKLGEKKRPVRAARGVHTRLFVLGNIGQVL